jgi:hypothetical protein
MTLCLSPVLLARSALWGSQRTDKQLPEVSYRSGLQWSWDLNQGLFGSRGAWCHQATKAGRSHELGSDTEGHSPDSLGKTDPAHSRRLFCGDGWALPQGDVFYDSFYPLSGRLSREALAG